VKIIRTSLSLVLVVSAACGTGSSSVDQAAAVGQGGQSQASAGAGGGGAGSGWHAPPPSELRWWKHIGGIHIDDVRSAAIDAAGSALIVGSFRDTVDFGGGPLTATTVSDVFVAKYTAEGVHLWSKGFGPGLNRGTDIAVDSQGSVILIGDFRTDAVDFGGGGLTGGGKGDIFVVKLSPDGEHVWSRALGGDGFDFAGSVACDQADDVLFATGLGSNVLLGKLSKGGELLWTRETGYVDSNLSEYPPIRDAAVDGNGDLILTGQFNDTAYLGGTPLISAGGGDIFVAKASGKDGAHIWSQRFGDSYSVIAEADRGYGVTIDEGNAIIVAGSFRGDVDLGGGPISSGEYDDAFLVKLGPDGGHVWSKNLGSQSLGVATGVAVDAQGNLAVMLTQYGPGNVGGGPKDSGTYLATYSPEGAFLSSRAFSSSITLGSVAGSKGGAALLSVSFYDEAEIDGTVVKALGYSDMLFAYFTP
jgi:hypothetical protein